MNLMRYEDQGLTLRVASQGSQEGELNSTRLDVYSG